jgi:hypothetical protein
MLTARRARCRVLDGRGRRQVVAGYAETASEGVRCRAWHLEHGEAYSRCRGERIGPGVDRTVTRCLRGSRAAGPPAIVGLAQECIARSSSHEDPEGTDVLTKKQKLVDVLRSRGESERADWVQRDLPDEFETGRHKGLLDMLRITPDDLLDVADNSRSDPGDHVAG